MVENYLEEFLPRLRLPLVMTFDRRIGKLVALPTTCLRRSFVPCGQHGISLLVLEWTEVHFAFFDAATILWLVAACLIVAVEADGAIEFRLLHLPAHLIVL